MVKEKAVPLAMKESLCGSHFLYSYSLFLNLFRKVEICYNLHKNKGAVGIKLYEQMRGQVNKQIIEKETLLYIFDSSIKKGCIYIPRYLQT